MSQTLDISMLDIAAVHFVTLERSVELLTVFPQGVLTATLLH